MPDNVLLDSATSRSREMAARLYNQKVDEYSAELARRLGPAYGTKEVDWPRLIALWETRDPDIDIDKAWDDAAKQANELIEKDPSVDPEKIKAEIPIEVARRVFPKREEAIKANGGRDYGEWASFADEIEKRAAAVRPPAPPERVPEPTVTLGPEEEMLPEPVPEMAPVEPAVPVAAAGAPVSPVTPATPISIPFESEAPVAPPVI